ncbi:organic solvent tolerance protein [Candidatus Pelagibacter sp.]|nr:organic solvent tolerance protein [Candidatus Pelagibacter sp.]
MNFSTYAAEVFNFDVTEVEIIEEGNKFLGKKGGTATSDDGTVIKANNFEYDKLKNILIAIGNVEIDDKKENIIITSQKVTYFKNKEFIFSEGQSQAINEDIVIDADNFEYNKINNVINANGNVKIDNKSENYLIYTSNAIYHKNEELFLTKGQSQAINEGIIIDADNFEYNKINNVINANGDVKIKDTINDYLILANDATYYKNLEKIITNGDTEAFIQSRYIINSKDVTYLHNDKILSSQHKSKIKDQDSQVYFAEKFNYSINEEIIKGEKFLIITNYNKPDSDKFFLKNAIINLKNKKFIASDTEVNIHKGIFNNTDNDPRIIGVSSEGDENVTLINKGVFTSCKKNDTCAPWSIKADTIKHDKIKKTLNYDNAILKIYDFPVLYFPKFFHPDPTVKRKSGLIQPEFNNSEVLGSSLTLPYFKVISKNKDLTLTPIWFDTDTLMSSLEYRQENKNSNFLSDFAFVNNYQSYTTKKTNSLSHLFLKYNLDLSLENFNSSDLNISINKVSNDSYLNVFDQYITKSKLRPGNFNQLTNDAVLNLDHENYNFETGVVSYENLGIKKQSDRYQYVLPYYTFDKDISQNYFSGNMSFGSSGNNVLNNTNKLETNIINNITYNSLDFISNLGFKNNFGINLKNLNSVGKKSTKYKSSTQSELISMYNMDLSLPLIKKSEISKNLLTPKLSFRFNPSDMKNYSKKRRTVDANNIWSINRLGLSDTYESGRSLTLGLNYSNERKDKLNQINNYFEMKLATIMRDKEEKFIPNNSTLNRINSNLFGSVTNKFSENIEIGYNFSLDNDLNTLEYNNIDTTISLNNIVTKFNFIEENGERGDSNIVSGSIAYNLDDKNFFSFETRQNRKLNLTEFYDLVYEYKNDCLTAGIRYKKTYYSDGDLRPTQNLFFTITLFPLTTYEHNADDLLENEDSFLNNLELSSEAFK